jgi:predicted RNA-binding protein YlxR (DUF448 family)
MCIACRVVQAQSSLLRLTKLPGGEVGLDLKMKQGGRGAYLCPKVACWEAALKRRRVEHALRLTTLSPEDDARLRQLMLELTGNQN